MSNIRFAATTDAKTILRFVHALAEYERQPDAVEVDEATIAHQLAQRPPPFECLLAEDTAGPTGFALFFHTYSTWRGKRGLWLEDLFVMPEARRRGIGRALIDRLASIAKERDCARFEWSVLDWNEPAIEFYRSLGAEIMSEWRICRIEGSRLAALGDK